jgi:hypothetical protein
VARRDCTAAGTDHPVAGRVTPGRGARTSELSAFGRPVRIIFDRT